MFQLNFSKKLLTSPIFPEEVFQSFEPEIDNTATTEDDPAESEPGSPVQSQ